MTFSTEFSVIFREFKPSGSNREIESFDRCVTDEAFSKL